MRLTAYQQFILFLAGLFAILFMGSCKTIRTADITTSEIDFYQQAIDSMNHYRTMMDSVVCLQQRYDSLYHAEITRNDRRVRDSVATNTFTRNDTVFVQSQYWHYEYERLEQQFENYRDIVDASSEYRIQEAKDSIARQYNEALIMHELQLKSHSEVVEVDKPYVPWYVWVLCIVGGISTIILLLAVGGYLIERHYLRTDGVKIMEGIRMKD